MKRKEFLKAVGVGTVVVTLPKNLYTNAPKIVRTRRLKQYYTLEFVKDISVVFGEKAEDDIFRRIHEELVRELGTERGTVTPYRWIDPNSYQSKIGFRFSNDGKHGPEDTWGVPRPATGTRTTCITNSQTLETIKNVQNRAITEDLGADEAIFEFLSSLVDPVVEQTYGDLIKRPNDFLVMTGPTSLAFYRFEKLVILAKIKVLPVQILVKDFGDRNKCIDELVVSLRQIALAEIEQHNMFGIYVPFQCVRMINPLTFEPSITFNTRYGIVDTSAFNS